SRGWVCDFSAPAWNCAEAPEARRLEVRHRRASRCTAPVNLVEAAIPRRLRPTPGGGRKMPRWSIAAARVSVPALWMLVLLGGSKSPNYPTRPLSVVVPFAAGGGVDVNARILAQRMGELLGQSIVIENVGAAAGMAGGARVAKAAPDGYT